MSRIIERFRRTPRLYQHTVHFDFPLKMVSPAAVKVCKTLQNQGFEAYIVGGAVRDLLCDLHPKDFDVATNATPNQIRKIFGRQAMIIGKRFRLAHIRQGNELIETSTFRSAPSSNKTDAMGRIISDNEFGDLTSDAKRRDFTLNSLYYDPVKQVIVDYHNGLKDLQNNTVRIIGDAANRYREDPVRMLRAVRFAAKLDAGIDKKTQAPIADMAPLLLNVSEARLFDEVVKLLSCGQLQRCIDLLQQLQLLNHLLPFYTLVYEQNNAPSFLTAFFSHTDARVQSQRSLRTGMLFAGLLWPLVYARYQALLTKHDPRYAIVLAAEQCLTLPQVMQSLPKRFHHELFTIWQAQIRLSNASMAALQKQVAHPSFKAFADFFHIRAEAGEVPSALAQFWLDLASMGISDRITALSQLPQIAPDMGKASKKPRKRRRKSAKSAPTNTAS